MSEEETRVIVCCCDREIARNADGDWDHVDGHGMRCWPLSHRPPDSEYTAEPADWRDK